VQAVISARTLSAEVFIPRPQESLLLSFQQPLDAAQLVRTEADVSGVLDRLQPELRRLVIAVHVSVRRLPQVMAVEMAVEVDPLRARSEDRRHPYAIAARP